MSPNAYETLMESLGITEREEPRSEYDSLVEGRAWTTKKGQNSKGGLNAAGRRSLKAEGKNIRPGVKNYEDASDRDKRRWISWATRFYSNPKGPLVDDDGEPTRLALMANAWGEPVPKTREAAQAIAAKARKRKEALDKREVSESYEMEEREDEEREDEEREDDGVDEGMLAGVLDEIGEMAKAGDAEGLSEYISGLGWQSSWDESVDDMTYKGREEMPALLRAVVEVARRADGKPSAEDLRPAIGGRREREV